MLQIRFENIVYPSIKFSLIKIEIGTGDITKTYYPELNSLGPFVIGHDDPDNILFMFPSSLAIEFYFPVAKTIINGTCTPSESQARTDMYEIMTGFRELGGKIYVYKDGQIEPYYCASYDAADDGIISCDETNKSISVEFLDDYTKLNDANTFVGYDSGGYPGGGGHLARKSIKKFVKEIFGFLGSRVIDTFVDTIEYKIDYRFTRIIDGVTNGVRSVDTEYCYLSDIGIDNWLFYHFDTKAECFKSILRNLAAYAVIDFNRNLKILPLYFNGGTIKQIYKSQIEGDNITEFCKRYEGMAVNMIYSEGVNYTTLLTQFKDYGKVVRILLGNAGLRNSTGGRGTGTVYGDYLFRNDERVFHLDIFFPCGGPDINNEDFYSNSKRVVHVANDDDVFNYDSTNLKLHLIAANKVSYKKSDGTWSDEMSLGEWASWLTWQTLNNKSRWKRAIMPGLDYEYGDFFHIEDLDGTFRPVKISYEVENDQTSLVLAECIEIGSYLNPTSILFNKILRPADWSCTIKKKVDQQFQYLDTDGASHSTGPNSPYLGNETLLIKIKNAFNCALSSAYEYDGIQLAVSDYDKKLWQDNWEYLIYIAIGKSKDTAAPASDYPFYDDANADWYLVDTLSDLNISDLSYYYQYSLTSKRIATKNPFWIWCGLKSSIAPLFENIPTLGK